jgi:hypothetical protein
VNWPGTEDGRGVRYVRIYTDDGVSRFEDVVMPLATTPGPPPAAPPLDLSALLPAEAIAFGRMPKGWRDVGHPSPGRLLFVLLSGTLEVTAGAETRRFAAGDVFLTEDTEGEGHAGHAIDEVTWVVVRLEALPA